MSNPIQFTHFDFNTPVYVYPELAGFVLYTPVKGCVVIIAGGAPCPVQGTLEEVTQKLTEAKSKGQNAQWATNKEMP